MSPADTPLLSIIIPAYNEERRLPESLEQVAQFVAQQEYPIEVIVVDNNSSDATSAIARAAGATGGTAGATGGTAGPTGGAAGATGGATGATGGTTDADGGAEYVISRLAST